MKKSWLWRISLLFWTVLFLLVKPSSFADLDGAETFPESRFGSPPAPPVYGQRQKKPVETELKITESSARGRGLDSLDQPVHPQAKSSLRTGTQEIAIIASDLGFFPKTVFVTRDIPVRLFITGASKKPLCMMLDQFNVRKQLKSQQVEEVSFTPTEPGQYRFYCPINGSEGSIFVKERTSASADLGALR